MQETSKAHEMPGKPGEFRFCSHAILTLLTGKRARDLAQLVENLRSVPGSVIYHHTHHYLEQHQHLSPEPPNDFAYWITNVLLEQRLGEELAAIDVLRFSTIHDLRGALVETIQRYLDSAENVRVAPPGQEFHFMRSVSFVLPTDIRATNLVEFRDALAHISLSSIAYHMFDARLRLAQADNDFSRWIETTLGERELAEALRNVDPYTHTEEGLRQRMIVLVNRQLEKRNGRDA
jgi:Family of unknown function (DUF5752)